MYGHKIIEGLNDDIKYFHNRENGGAVRYWEKTRAEIKDSIHFYFDAPVTDSMGMTDRQAQTAVGDVFKTLAAPLPFRPMIVQCRVLTVEAEKAPMAALALQSDIGTTVKVFIFHKDTGQWESSAVNFSISANGEKAGFHWAWDVKGTCGRELTAYEKTESERVTCQGVIKLAKMIQLLNCKNITSTDTHPPEKLQKKRAKRGRVPIFTYKTLKILVPGKGRSSNSTDKEKNDLYYNRIHLCRGHFKTFTKDKPLFGRLTGMYWWQPSVRGNKENGVIHKDYAVSVA